MWTGRDICNNIVLAFLMYKLLFVSNVILEIDLDLKFVSSPILFCLLNERLDYYVFLLGWRIYIILSNISVTLFYHFCKFNQIYLFHQIFLVSLQEIAHFILSQGVRILIDVGVLQVNLLHLLQSLGVVADQHLHRRLQFVDCLQ